MHAPLPRTTALLAAVVGLAFATPAAAAPCIGVTFGAGFAGSYTCETLGTPAGLTPNLGGITFLNNSTVLLGGSANNADGYIQALTVIRDGGNHITGFSASTSFATAPFIDGGLSFGTAGLLYATGYPNNTILQYLPGSTAPDKIVTLSGDASSVGALAFVPAGFAGAGQMKIVSYSNANWYTGNLAADGLGTFDISLTSVTNLATGINPEGIAYVSGVNAGFGGDDTVLVSLYNAGIVRAYDIDANGDPIVGTGQDFVSGLGGAEGAVIDPLTGDFIFSTFGSGNQVVVIRGFEAPPAVDTPEPASLALLGCGLLGLAGARRRR